MFFIPTFWTLLTLVPYLIYRRVDKKWGGQGKRNAILIVLAINVLFLGFFAFQIYYLHNSYRGLPKNAQGQVDSTPGFPSNICPDRLIIKKDKPTTARWNGKTLEVVKDEQNWVEQNCPGALKHP